jgi:polyferredoxin
MAKVGRPPNLIAYDSERNQELRAEGKAPVFRIVRPRTMLYVAVLLLATAVMAGTFLTRATSELSVIPERNPLFVTMADGSIRNAYNVRILNKAHAERVYTLSLDEAAPPHTLTSSSDDGGTSLTLTAPPDEVATHRVFVRVPPDDLTESSTPITMVLTDNASGEERRISTVFRGP